MSVEIRAKIICDGCGAFIDGPVETRTTIGMQTYWKAKREAKRKRWMTLLRYGTTPSQKILANFRSHAENRPEVLCQSAKDILRRIVQ